MHYHIGTSGWHYKHWRGPFYPGGLSEKLFLKFYARQYDTVEINNTFYGLPKKETLRRWYDETPPAFLFSVKASGYITHRKKLRDAKEAVSVFLETVQTLGDKLGPIVFQLPPQWHFDESRFRDFLAVLPDRFRYTFEFRDPTWFGGQVNDALMAKGAAFCIYDFDGRTSPLEVTAGFVYVRLHGPKEAYRGRYEASVLSRWLDAFKAWAGQGKEIFCYFDNDEGGYAAGDALHLKQMLEQEGGR